VIDLATCSQCGQEAPSEAEQLAGWRHGDLVLRGELDEATAGLVLCPDCWEEDRAGAFDAGGQD
jgi:hypothetical protein